MFIAESVCLATISVRTSPRLLVVIVVFNTNLMTVDYIKPYFRASSQDDEVSKATFTSLEYFISL